MSLNLLAISKVLSGSLDASEALTTVLELMCQELGWRTCSFFRLQQDGGYLYCQSFYAATPCPSFEEITRKIKFERGIGLPGRVWQRDEPQWIEDVVKDSNFPRAAFAKKDGLHAAFAFPVKVRETFLGVFEFFSSSISPPDTALLETFSIIAIELGQLLDRQRIEKELAQQALLNAYAAEIGSAVNKLDSLPSLMDQCAQLTAAHLGCLATIWTYESDSDEVKLIAGAPADSADCEKNAFLTSDQFKTMLKKGQPYFTNDALSDSQIADTAWVSQQGISAFALHPLILGDEILGAMTLFSQSTLSEATLETISRIANMLASCIARKKSEERLTTSEGLFREFAANVNEVFFVSEPKLAKHFYVSPAFERIWGYGLEELYKNPYSWADYIIEEHRDRVVAYVERMEGETMPEDEIEYAIKNAQGKEIWLSARTFAAIAQHNGLWHTCGTVRDITERKRAENRVSEFYSMVSHELKTPLTSMKGVLLLLERGRAGPLTKEAEQLIKLGRKECDRLIRLVNNMLDIKRIEVGKLMLYRQRIDVFDAIAQTIDMFAGTADLSRIKISLTNNDKVYVLADRDRFVQILTNLISNALKYSPPDSEISVQVESGGDFVKFYVVDTGSGIPEPDQTKLFQVFQQVASQDGKPKEGTGLGLAICKGIVEAHGGRIGVTSRPQLGSTFWFELPAGREDAEDAS